MTGQRYEYDEENRLTEVHRGTTDEFLLESKYDALGRRIESVDYLDESSQGETVCGAGGKGGIGVSPVVTRYIYAGLETLEEHVSCDAGLTWTLAREYLWGDRFPEPLAMIDHTDLGDSPAGTDEVLHYIHGALGSVVALTDSAGAEVERYTYDPYGPTYIEDPVTGDRRAASSYGNPWMWTAQRYDAGVNLYHFTFRAYSPRLGRWLQRDPLGYVDGVSLHEYVMSMPTYFTDSVGLCSGAQLGLIRIAMRNLNSERNQLLNEVRKQNAKYDRDIDKLKHELKKANNEKLRLGGCFPTAAVAGEVATAATGALGFIGAAKLGGAWAIASGAVGVAAVPIVIWGAYELSDALTTNALWGDLTDTPDEWDDTTEYLRDYTDGIKEDIAKHKRNKADYNRQLQSKVSNLNWLMDLWGRAMDRCLWNRSRGDDRPSKEVAAEIAKARGKPVPIVPLDDLPAKCEGPFGPGGWEPPW